MFLASSKWCRCVAYARRRFWLASGICPPAIKRLRLFSFSARALAYSVEKAPPLCSRRSRRCASQPPKPHSSASIGLHHASSARDAREFGIMRIIFKRPSCGCPDHPPLSRHPLLVRLGSRLAVSCSRRRRLSRVPVSPLNLYLPPSQHPPTARPSLLHFDKLLTRLRMFVLPPSQHSGGVLRTPLN